MKTYLGIVLIVAAFSLINIGQVFAQTDGIQLTSTCPDGTYPVTCGPVVVTVTSFKNDPSVKLSTSVSPGCSSHSCLNATMNPDQVSMPAGGHATSNLQLSGRCGQFPNCEWVVTITGNDGSHTNSTSVFVCYGRDCPI